LGWVIISTRWIQPYLLASTTTIRLIRPSQKRISIRIWLATCLFLIQLETAIIQWVKRRNKKYIWRPDLSFRLLFKLHSTSPTRPYKLLWIRIRSASSHPRTLYKSRVGLTLAEHNIRQGANGHRRLPLTLSKPSISKQFHSNSFYCLQTPQYSWYIRLQ
jgi:hypothetical protein